MLAFAAWWLLAVALGWVAFPLMWRLLSGLPDRGLGFSKALGLLASGYILWAGASLGVLINGLGGAWMAVFVLLVLSLSLSWKDRGAMLRWLRGKIREVLAYEILFLVAFGAWAFVRANNPQIQHTEKPMELAFLNAVLHAPRFPPPDPWLSGYAISYYYFGYVLLAFLSRLSGVPASVAFNLGNAMWFALTVSGSYAIVYNLVALRKQGLGPLLAGLLGPAVVLLMGNLEGVLEVLHHSHIFWRVNPDGSMTSPFWKWLNIQRLAEPPTGLPTRTPTRFLWWWQASRVIYDVDLAGRAIEMIDEFPFFTFLLADNHPHLLALPFVFAAIGLALHVFLTPRPAGENIEWGKLVEQGKRGLPLAAGFVVLLSLIRMGSAMAAGGVGAGLGTFARTALLSILALGIMGIWYAVIRGKVPIVLHAPEFWLGGWLFGALVFLNTWDFPIYFSLLGAVLLWQVRDELWPQGLARVGVTMLGAGVTSGLFYLLWFPTFSSQAGGILPNLIFPTRLAQFAVMFGGMLTPLVGWLILRAREGWRKEEGALLIKVALGVPLALLLLSLSMGAVAYIALIRSPDVLAGVMVRLGLQSPAALEVLIGAAAIRRLTASWTTLLLGALMGMGVVLLMRRASTGARGGEEGVAQARTFVFLLVIVASFLVMGPEFFYLRDSFGTRMNTIFKLYFAGWILWGLATAYAVYELLPRAIKPAHLLRTLLLVPLLLGFVYPVLAVRTKAEGFKPAQGRTLDGMAYLRTLRPGDYAAIRWIQENLDSGVVAEAVGPSYSEFGRVATHTGLSAVLQWPGHELQWRGGSEEQGSRADDIARLYQTSDWREAQRIVELYGIDYVYIGPLERQSYQPLNETKFSQFMELIYQSDEVLIYARR